MAKLFMTAIFIFAVSIAKSQNLLSNGDFENYSSLPSGTGQLNLATGWSNLNTGITWPFATPDYLHTSGSGIISLPNSVFGTIHPYSGNAIVGFVTKSSAIDFREYLSANFSSPMVPGTTYTISFWLSNGESNQYSGNSSNHIGARLSTLPLYQTDHEPVTVIPQLEIPGQVWTTSWQNFSFSFIADSAYEYITIGNFFNDASTNSVFQVNGSIAESAYYFIDKIEVTPNTTVPVTLTKFSATKKDGDVLLNWSTVQEINTKEFIIEHSTDGTAFYPIGKVKAAGNYGAEKNYSFIHTAPSTGANYYRLKMVDNDGSYIYSEIKKATFNISGIKMAAKPNPFSDAIFLNVSSDATIGARLFIMDVTGRVMYKQEAMLRRGVNAINIQTQQLAKGLYIIEMIAGNEKQTINMVKD